MRRLRIRGAAGAWRVPLRVGDTPATIAGDVRRAAATGGGGIGLVLAFFGPAVLVLAAALFLGRRERRSLTTTVEAW